VAHLAAIAALALAGTLLYSAGTKLTAFNLFAETLSDYRLLPGRLTRFAAVAVIVLETLGGVFLVMPGLRRPGALIGMMLLGTFLIGQSIVYRQGRSIPCGCFGKSTTEGDEIGPPTMFRTGTFLILAAIPAVLSAEPIAPLHWLGAVLMVTAIAVTTAAMRLITRGLPTSIQLEVSSR
jgi:uncharacterized membrane protein YphA (DoxX/SURF4 family)